MYAFTPQRELLLTVQGVNEILPGNAAKKVITERELPKIIEERSVWHDIRQERRIIVEMSNRAKAQAQSRKRRTRLFQW